MKNIAISLAMIILLAACSSGSTVAPLPTTTNSRYTGTFENLQGTQSGQIVLDIVESEDGTISGNLIYTSNGENCLRNTTIANGNTNGFNVNVVSNEMTRTEFIITTTVATSSNTTTTVRISDTGTVGTVTNTVGGRTTTITTDSNDLTGIVNYQLALSNNGNTLSGTYVTTGNICSNQTGTGNTTLNRG